MSRCLRKDLIEIILGISELEDIQELTMTTNAQMLPRASTRAKKRPV